ncbi:MAG: hypothetical protein JXA81_14695, partial [Sedimentisphaerales bacterium]|nr:hypothetical protein [Sedimentisphaerales bacterium]
MENKNNQNRCPKCSKENPDNARFCNACGCSLMQTPEVQQRIEVKISRLATTSFICALCGLTLLMPTFIGMSYPRSRIASFEWTRFAFMSGIIILGFTAILGMVSVIRIERSGGRITGRNFAIGAVFVSIFGALLVLICPMIGPRRRSTAFRMVCGTNLSRIGKAMLIYANDYEDKFPQTGGRSSVWAAKIPDWKAKNRFDAYNVRPDGTGGQGSISSSFYLLVKYGEAEPKRFICTHDSGTKEFKPSRYKARDRDLIDLWDFGPEPQKHCSYSYHVPYGGYPLTTSCDPGLAVAADRNPWMDSPF